MDEQDRAKAQEQKVEGKARIESSRPSRPWQPQDADRESIRLRVRGAKFGENAVFIPGNPKKTIHDFDAAKVAVYARISTNSIEQVSSIENQTKYYTEKIASTPGWMMQRIYSDEGKSGTSMRRRTEFKRMLQDAKDQKMDLILCASVSRFARNVADCVEEVRKLKTTNPSHPVGVYFETENIYTLDENSDNTFKVHAVLADWESGNRSRRMILSYDQRICTGQFPVSDLLGYRHTADGQLIVHKDEAVTVRYIYTAFLAGHSCEHIANVLTESRRPTLKGRTAWSAGMVRNIMFNERRWGDLSARKTICIDHVSGKTVKNDHIRDAAYVTGHHAGIVTPEIGKAVRLLSASNRAYCETVPELELIPSGVLKGFISILPGWNGVSAQMLEEICRSAYSSEEGVALDNEAKIISGEEHSRLLDMRFDGYEVPRGVSFMNLRSPALTVDTKSIRFGAACHKQLNHATHIEVLYHPILQTLAIRSCNADASNAIKWSKMYDHSRAMKVCSKALASAIYEKLRWKQEYRFKFRGITKVRGDERIMFFYLDEPEVLVQRGKKTADNASLVQYIPIRENEGNEDNEAVPAAYVYPAAWEKSGIGVSYMARRLRDRVAGSVTSADIGIRRRIVVNPLVGEIPDAEELEAELKKLRSIMEA